MKTQTRPLRASLALALALLVGGPVCAGPGAGLAAAASATQRNLATLQAQIDRAAARREWAGVLALLPKLQPFAQALLRTRQWDALIALHTRALEATQAAKGMDDPLVGERLDLLASALYLAGRYADSIPQYRRALAIAERQLAPGDDTTQMRIVNLAAAYDNMGDYASARVLYERSLASAESAYGPDHPYTVMPLINLGSAILFMGQAADARPLLERALANAERGTNFNNAVQVGNALSALGGLYRALGDLKQALDYAQRALVVAEQDKGSQHPQVLSPLLQVAGLHVDLGDYQGALPLYRRALALSLATRGVEDAASLGGLAEVLSALGQDAEALQLFQRAASLTEALGVEHPVHTASLSALALEHASLGQHARARELLQQALPATEKAYGAEHRMTASALLGLAGETPDPAEAAPLVRRAVAILERARGAEHPDTARALMDQAGVEHELHHDVDALSLYERALAILDAKLGPQHPDAATCRTRMAELQAQLGHHAQAQALYASALASVGRAQSPRTSFAIERSYAEFLRARYAADRAAHASEGEQAIFFAKLAVNSFQQVRAGARTLQRDLQASLLRDNDEVYQELGDWLVESGRLAEAEEVLEMLKDRELRDLVRRDGGAPKQLAMSGPEAALARGYETLSVQAVTDARELEALDARVRQRDALSEREQARRAELQAISRSHAQALQSFLTQIQDSLASDAAAAQRRRDQVARDAQGMQTLLRRAGPGHVGLTYVLTDERVSIIVSLPGRSFARQMPVSRADLTRQLQLLRTALHDERFDPRPPAQALYRLLIAPVREELEAAHAHTLVLSLSDNLRYVPFAVLHDGSEYLVERWALALRTSAGGDALQRSDAHSWRVAGMGVTRALTAAQFQESFRALPAVRDELRSIVRTAQSPEGVLPGAIALDAQFTRTRFEQASAEDSVLHVASHFQFTPGSQDRSYLLLGDGSALTLADLKDMDFTGVQLLTLSACDTAWGGGRDESGAEVEGLAAAMQQAGARAVLATLWPVSDASTAELMQHFYQLRSGARGQELGSARTLREVQLAMLHGEGSAVAGAQRGATVRSSGTAPTAGLVRFEPDRKAPFAHPYFWAPFILMGSWL